MLVAIIVIVVHSGIAGRGGHGSRGGRRHHVAHGAIAQHVKHRAIPGQYNKISHATYHVKPIRIAHY